MDGVGCTGSRLGLLLQGCGRLLSSIEARGMLSQGASSLVPTACFLGLCTNGKWDKLLCQTTCMATTNSMNFMHGHSSLGNGTSQIDCSSGHVLLFYVLQCCTLLHTHTHTHTLLLSYSLHCCTLLHTHILLYILQGCALLHTHTYTHTTHIHTPTQHTHIHTSPPLRPPKIAPSYRHTHTHFSSSTSSKAVPSYLHTHTHTHTHTLVSAQLFSEINTMG